MRMKTVQTDIADRCFILSVIEASPIGLEVETISTLTKLPDHKIVIELESLIEQGAIVKTDRYYQSVEV